MGSGTDSGNEHGTEAEDAARRVAADLGLPDFVFTVPRLPKSAGSREVGDALLIANGAGAVVQVKARRPGASDDGSSWVLKAGSKAARQAAGSLRSIRMAQEQGDPLVALPVRTAGLPSAAQAQAAMALTAGIGPWHAVIVIDHPAADGVVPPADGCFWITLADWHELWAALRSVTGMLTYVRRVLDAGMSVPLGEEPRRFARMVQADVADHGPAAWLTTETYDDPLGAQLYRELVDRVWPGDESLPAVGIADYRLIVNFLDSAAPGVLPRIGRWVLGKREEAAQRGRSGGLLLLDNDRLLVYKAQAWSGPESETTFDAELLLAALVRSAEASEQLGRFVPALAVGHLVGPDHTDHRYAYTRSAVVPTAAETALVLHGSGRFDMSKQALVALPSTPRGLPCPCGSGVPAGECPRSLLA